MGMKPRKVTDEKVTTTLSDLMNSSLLRDWMLEYAVRPPLLPPKWVFDSVTERPDPEPIPEPPWPIAKVEAACKAVWQDDKSVTWYGEEYEIEEFHSDLTFDSMAKLSELLGTRNINVTTTLGGSCESDTYEHAVLLVRP